MFRVRRHFSCTWARFPCSPFLAARHQRDRPESKQRGGRERCRSRSCTRASRWDAAKRGVSQNQGRRGCAVVVCRVLFVGIPCDVRAMQGAAVGRTARQQGRQSARVAGEAADQAARWAVVGGIDGRGFEGEHSDLSALFHCNAYWPDGNARRRRAPDMAVDKGAAARIGGTTKQDRRDTVHALNTRDSRRWAKLFRLTPAPW